MPLSQLRGSWKGFWVWMLETNTILSVVRKYAADTAADDDTDAGVDH